MQSLDSGAEPRVLWCNSGRKLSEITLTRLRPQDPEFRALGFEFGAQGLGLKLRVYGIGSSSSLRPLHHMGGCQNYGPFLGP